MKNLSSEDKEDPEALAQLSRLLAEVDLRGASAVEAQAAVQRHLQRLADGLIAEAAASDDVFSRDSALEFLEARLSFFAALIADSDTNQLRQVLREKVEAW